MPFVFRRRRDPLRLLIHDVVVPDLERLPLHNLPDILRAIRRIRPMRMIPPPLPQVHDEPILTHHHRSRRRRSIRRAERRGGIRIANLPDQYAPRDGIQDRVRETAGCHQRCADAVEGQRDVFTVPDGEASGGERERESDVGDGVDDHEARGAADLVGACGAGGGEHLLDAAAEKDEDVQVDYHAAELRGENPKVMEAETLIGDLLDARSLQSQSRRDCNISRWGEGLHSSHILSLSNTIKIFVSHEDGKGDRGGLRMGRSVPRHRWLQSNHLDARRVQ